MPAEPRSTGMRIAGACRRFARRIWRTREAREGDARRNNDGQTNYGRGDREGRTETERKELRNGERAKDRDEGEGDGEGKKGPEEDPSTGPRYL